MHAEHVMSAWFIKTGDLETLDRELTQIKSRMLNCVKWPCGVPKHCEVEFFLDTVAEKVPRKLTGIG